PERVDDFVARLGQAARAAAVRRNDPEARELFAQSGAVEPPVEIRDPTRRRLLLVADAEPLLTALREHRDAPAVGRPCAGTRARRELGKLPRLPAGERQEPRLRLPGTAREEYERLPVRRKPRPAVGVAGRDLLGAAAAHRHAPEPRLVGAVLDRAPPVD